MSEADHPLILTLALDETSFARFDGLRRQHFPPERNIVPAHITLFHHLPGAREADIAGELAGVCREQPSLTLTITGLRSLGRGVAYTIEAPVLQELRGRLARVWQDWLTPQDRQRYQPHITVQNKATPDEARALLAELSAGFEPFAARGEGLLLWRYLNGPWRLLREFRFEGAEGRRNVGLPTG